MRAARRFPLCLLALAFVALPACRVTDLPLWGPLGKPPVDAYPVERVQDIAYHDSKDADRQRHRLDLFLPRGKSDYPVVILVHGGAWIMGDNRCCGLYSTVGEHLASQGIGAVLPNYRLSPNVMHPKHIKDLARAFAWTKKQIGKRGGRADQIFLVGHSAGGHLVALLATDEQYLKAEGCKSDDIRGVIGISGVYRIPPGPTEVELGGSGPKSVRFDEMTPLRGTSGPIEKSPTKPGMPIRVNVFGPVFGDDPEMRRAASPIAHVRPGLPPFLLLNAERDLPLLPEMAQEMEQALRKIGSPVQLIKIEGRNHNSIMFKAAEPGDPVARHIVEFIREHIPAAKVASR